MRYALVEAGLVLNIIESATPPGGSWQPCGDAGPGWTVAGSVFSPPAEPAPAPTPAWLWFIDPGSFRDRFGAAKMAVLTSADPGVKALLTDMQGRSWIDLQSTEVHDALAYIGSMVPAVDEALQAAILTTPVSDFEGLALRKLYFS